MRLCRTMPISCPRYKTLAGLAIAALLSTACSSSRYAIQDDHGPQEDVNVSHIPDATPRSEPLSKYGNPESYVVNGRRYEVLKTAAGFRQQGLASWYGKKFHGHRTSSGETYNMYGMTAAHKQLPLPCYVEVTNLDNGKSVVVRVNDRGPFHDDRIIDLSYTAAKKLDIIGHGTGRVEIRHIDPNQAPVQTRSAAINNKPAEAKSHAARRAALQNKGAQRLYIQVGAFSERSNAEQLQRRVADILSSGEINTGYNVENKLYRVRIGPLASVEEADRLADQLSQSGIADPKVIAD